MSDTNTQLNERVEALAAAVELASGRLEPQRVEPAEALVARVRGRLRHGTDRTVVALAGPTGAGKSTFFNALTGAEISTTGVRRPTTSSTHAAQWGEGASDLLDWLGVERRHQAPPNADLDGLILLDLPDFDSTERSHQMEVDRLVELVDLLVWVVDPQKYADQSLHEQYLRPLKGHGEVMRFVLNKADTLANPSEVAEDFVARLADDGIDGAEVIALSATSGEGVAAGHDLLRSIVSERRASMARLDADLRSAADMLEHADAATQSGDALAKSDQKELVQSLGRAAGVESAATVVADQYLRDGGLATGWPASRWVRKIRKTPLRALPSPAASSVASAEVGVAVRDAAEAAASRLEPGWAASVRHDLRDAQPEVLERLGTVPLRAADAARVRPAWWSIFSWLQRLAALVAIVGAVWLLVLVIGESFFRLDTDPLTPMINDWLPVPTALLIGGVVVGVLLGLVAKIPLSVGSKRRGASVRKDLHAHVETIAEATVISRLDATLADHRELGKLLVTVRGQR